MGWTWQYESADGTATESESFPSQGDAESYIGECWRELREQGITAVTLYEDGRKVYGPMPLDEGS